MNIRFVVKVTKLCNLRCTYCYETSELANRARMSLENIEKMFLHIKEYIRQWGKRPKGHKVLFGWHGGEPFTLPISYWENVFAIQKRVFGTRFIKEGITNVVQTNLTRLTDKHLPLLRRFDQLGFSYDVANDRRVDAGGKSTAEVVEKKVDWLLSKGFRLFGIAVISKSNIDNPKLVADYFLERGLSFRAVHLFLMRDALPETAAAAVPFETYMGFYQKLYQLPEVRGAMENGILIDPFSDVDRFLEKWASVRRLSLPDESDEDYSEREWVLNVNTNGDIYGSGDVYNPYYKYGNIFSQTFDEWLSSEGRARRIERSRERLNKICEKCFLYRKGCDGLWVSNATPEAFRDFERNRACHYQLLAKMMLESPKSHLENRPPLSPASVESLLII